MLSKTLTALRDQYDAETLTTDDFIDQFNDALDHIKTSATDAQKIAAYDKIAKFVRDNYRLENLDDGVQPIKSDLSNYFFESAFQAVVGDNCFGGFYNKTYEAG
jgi:hypothetical protein